MLKWQRILVVVAITAILFFLDRVRVFDSTVSFGRRVIIRPLFSVVVSAAEETSFFLKSFFSLRGLVEENLFLKSQRDFFRQEYFRVASLEEENKLLRQALRLEKTASGKLVLGNILSFDPFQANDTFRVAVGSAAGVKVSSPVILGGGVLVGRVEEVSPKENLVRLITSVQSRITVLAQGIDGANGVITGSATGALDLDLVLRDVKLNPGQIVLTSGLDGVFPQGLLVGEISKISSESTASFQKASVRPFFNLRDLKQVFILVKD